MNPIDKIILPGTPSQNIRIFKKNWIPILSNVDRLLILVYLMLVLRVKIISDQLFLQKDLKLIFLFN